MDKRKAERYDLDILVELTADESKEKETHRFRGLHTNNISSEGAFIATKKHIPEGSHVELELLLPVEKLLEIIGQRKKIKVKVKGRVVRTGAEGIAVQFDKGYKISAIAHRNHMQ